MFDVYSHGEGLRDKIDEALSLSLLASIGFILRGAIFNC